MSKNVFDNIASQFLGKIEDLDHPPTREEKFMASILLKNIYDMCCAGELIIAKNPKNENIVNPSIVKIFKIYLKTYYSNDFFIESDQFGTEPNWEKINSFNEDKFNDSCKIYMAIKKNVINKPKIYDSILKRDKKYFIDNFDDLFMNLPMAEYLSNFKKFIEDDTICSKEDQEIIWSYFEVIIDLFFNEDEYISSLNDE